MKETITAIVDREFDETFNLRFHLIGTEEETEVNHIQYIDYKGREIELPRQMLEDMMFLYNDNPDMLNQLSFRADWQPVDEYICE